MPLTRVPSFAPRLVVLLAVVAVTASAAIPAAAIAPDAVPDRLPVASEHVQRGALITEPAPPRTPTRKAPDGRIDDWSGAASGIGGTARLDAGEHIYTDFLFDDFGADDGDDARRLAILGPLQEAESRTARVDQLFQAAGDQFGAPRPVGAPDHYGDGDRTDAADLREVRWSADGQRLNLLVRTTTLTDERLGVVVLADVDGAASAQSSPVGFDTGLRTQRFDVALLLSAGRARLRDLRTGEERNAPVPVRVNPSGWTNALEASMPAGMLPSVFDVAVISGVRSEAGITPANVAYRFDEPVAGVYNDRDQALALHAGSIDEFTTTLDVAALRSGVSEHARPGPGYAERHMRSGDNISREQGEHGIWQPYGLYVPASYEPGVPAPLTFWLHYRGGKAHSGAAWTPRLITQLGEESGNVVVTPRARGTSTWYVTEAHQDFFEAFADVHGLLDIDASRRYLSGYSMGGYGTYLFGLLYPDLFAAGYSTAGAVTQGAWTGEGPDECRSRTCFVEANSGDADAQLTYRVLENARHVPLVIHHGTNDELVPITGVQRMGLRLAELGYRYDLTMFTGYEHYTQAIIDEWADGAEYLQQFTSPDNPRTVTYKVVPALVDAVNTVTADGVAFSFNPDGAYWTDGLVVRDGDASDTSAFGQIDATSLAIEDDEHLTVPRTGAASPGNHSTPYTRHGLDWLPTGAAPTSNAFTATLTNLAAASLDVARMQLDLAGVVDGTITTDGATTLTLANVATPVDVFVDGVAVQRSAAGDIALQLDGGEHLVQLRPSA